MPEILMLKPYGGLANRMRAIDSAMNLARDFNIKLNVIWELTPELNCSYFSLFKPDPNITINEYSLNVLFRKTYHYLSENLTKFGINLPFGYDLFLTNNKISKLLKQNTDFNFLLSHYQSIYINTVHQFYKQIDTFYRFQIVDEIQTKINNYTSNFNRHCVGVHIRRTDNATSIKHCPTEYFIDYMNKELISDPEVIFYLATDSPEEENVLKQIFDNRIITHNKTVSRNCKKGIQDALIDLICLSNTSKIIGSYYSSFSEVAAQINNIELIQVFRA